MKDLNKCFIEPEKEITKKEFHPASYIRKSFSIGKEIKKAELHITACGLYRCYLNGEAVTDQVFMPGFTYYEKRLQYQTFDVSSLLKKGTNVIAVILGDGWYRGKIGLLSRRYYYGKKTKLAAILEIQFTDDSIERITTDPTWKATQKGPIRKSDWKDGEIYDARKELMGWLEADYEDEKWHGVYPAFYDGELIPNEGEKILEQERFNPEVITTPDGSTVLDFKQNLFGYVEFTITGKSGHVVNLIHGETLDENGNFTLKNLGLIGKKKTFQHVKYFLKEGRQTYKPSFTAHGFQYVKVENWPEPVLSGNFTSIAVYSNCERTGTFECSHPLINQLVRNALWSQKSNFMAIPTDCPQRERAGWTGDIACYARTATYLMDVYKFLRKWCHDLAIQQKPNGIVASIVPDVGFLKFTNGSAGWGDAAVIVPHVLYQVYGKKEILNEQYPSMVKWMDFLEKRAKKTHVSRWFKKNPHKKHTIDSGFHFGEWQEPGHPMLLDGVKGVISPDFEVATGCYAYSAKLMAEIATILGKSVDAKKYEQLFENIKKGYRYNYTEEGIVNSKRQCKYVRPIAYDLLSEEETLLNVEKLNKLVIKNDYRISTGFLTTPWILQVLSDHGYIETAYKMVENTERPGWLYEVRKGATTIWENWNGIDDKGVPQDSHNHYLMGSVVSWLFSHVAGIRALEPGYEKVLIEPIPGGSITHVNCSYESPSGLIKSSWKRKKHEFILNIEVPTETEIILPDGSRQKRGAGKHEFSCPL